jgi:putative ABC transport system permease protein
VVCGVLLSLYASRALSKWTEGSVQSPLIFLGVTLALVATAALAAWIPARRASSVDPMSALRYE